MSEFRWGPTAATTSTVAVRVVRIGDAHGRIAVYFDKQAALDLANLYGPGDLAYDELLVAVERAYPDEGEPA